MHLPLPCEITFNIIKIITYLYTYAHMYINKLSYLYIKGKNIMIKKEAIQQPQKIKSAIKKSPIQQYKEQRKQQKQAKKKYVEAHKVAALKNREIFRPEIVEREAENFFRDSRFIYVFKEGNIYKKIP